MLREYRARRCRCSRVPYGGVPKTTRPSAAGTTVATAVREAKASASVSAPLLYTRDSHTSTDNPTRAACAMKCRVSCEVVGPDVIVTREHAHSGVETEREERRSQRVTLLYPSRREDGIIFAQPQRQGLAAVAPETKIAHLRDVLQGCRRIADRTMPWNAFFMSTDKTH